MTNSLTVTARRAGDGWTCEVEVGFQGRRSRHIVNVTPHDLARWGSGAGEAEVEDLVRRSFEFLLEREPATSILALFDLEVIQRYFPDYDQQFRKR